MSCPDYVQLTLNCYRLTIFGKIVCDFDPSLLFKAPSARSAHTHTNLFIHIVSLIHLSVTLAAFPIEFLDSVFYS